MKTNTFLSFLISFLLWNCTKESQNASFSVQISKMGIDTVSIYLTPFGERMSDNSKTVITKNGKFEFDTLISKPHQVFLQPKKMFKQLSDGTMYPIYSKMIIFFIYPKRHVEITGEMKEFRTNYMANGNLLNRQYARYREETIDNYEMSSKMMLDYENNYIQNLHDSTIVNRYKELNYVPMDSINRKFIFRNLNKEITAYLLLNSGKDEILKNFEKLENSVKKSDFGIILNEKLEKWKKVAINSIPPDFEYETYRNGKFKLSQNKEKFVVLDFWGSWCGPCFIDMPKMKEFYAKNKNKVEIVGIAANDKKENWEKAILENELNWTNILNNKKTDDLVQKFGITGYPTKVIINPEGIIKGIYLGKTDDFFEKMNELLSSR